MKDLSNNKEHEKIRKFISRPLHKHIDYIITEMRKVIPKQRYTAIQAEILYKKFYNYIIGNPIRTVDNLDTVQYTDNDNPLLISDPITFLEEYIGMQVYKYSGISYSDYKEMTPYERYVALKFIALKRKEEQVVSEVMEKELDEEGKKLNEMENDNDLGLYRGFSINSRDI